MISTETSMQGGGNSGIDIPPIVTAMPGDGDEGFSDDEYAELLNDPQKVTRGLGYAVIRGAFSAKRELFDDAIRTQFPASLPLYLGDFNHGTGFRYN